MQKKVSAILLTILYLTSNTGFAINLEFIEHMFMDDINAECSLSDYHHDDEGNCSFYAYTCEYLINSKSVEPIHTIYDYLNEGVKHNHDTHNCKSELLVLITNKDLLSNNYQVKIPNLHFPVSKNYTHLIEQMYNALVYSTEDTKDFPKSTIHFKEPLYVAFQQLVLYS